MTDFAIRAEGLGKLYFAERSKAAGKLSETVTAKIRNAFRSRLLRFADRPPSGENPATATRFWALRRVCLQARPGEALGILGGNGAGKTTLLRILSRITFPTEGRAQIRGRVAALLDCGAALHGELTGRENVRLYGRVLGMTRRETEQKFDEIVSFAGVEKFIDIPIKRYSTGMCLRLAFSVAAHMEPDVLLVDDVLGAADTAFQKKCLEKMTATTGKGGTLILVSHDPGHVRSLCTSGVVLARGRLVYSGPAPGAADFYAAHAEPALEPQIIGLKEMIQEA